jgi:hypothetical protein
VKAAFDMLWSLLSAAAERLPLPRKKRKSASAEERKNWE